MGQLVDKEYLQKQFSGYSTVVKEQLDKKVNIEQGVDNKGKLLGVDDTGNVSLIEAPDGVTISAEEGNKLETKSDGLYVSDMSTSISADADNMVETRTDGIYVKDMSAKISAETDNKLEQKTDGLYVADMSAKVSAENGNIITPKDDGLFAEETIKSISIDNTPLTVDTDKNVNLDLSGYVKYEQTIADDGKVLKVVNGSLTLSEDEGGQTIQVTTLPTASVDELDKIYQYVGATTTDYTNGYFYKCIEDTETVGTYIWSNISIQSGGENPSWNDLNDRPFKSVSTDDFVVDTDGVLSLVETGTVIEDWVADTEYAEKDIVIYDSQLYRCVTANTDATWTVENWELLDDSFEEIDVETLKTMLGVSTEDIEKVIDDTQILTTKAYSSSKVNELITALDDKYLSLDGGVMSNGATIYMNSESTGVSTKLDANELMFDDVTNGQTTSVSGSGIETPSLKVNNVEVLTKDGGEMNTSANIKFNKSNGNGYVELYVNGLDLVDNDSGGETYVTSDSIETPEIVAKKITVDGASVVTEKGAYFNENATVTLPSTSLGANFMVQDDYLTASLYADGLYVEDTDTSESTHVGASGITTPSLTVGETLNGYNIYNYTNIDVSDKITNTAYTGTSTPYLHLLVYEFGAFAVMQFSMYNVTFSSSSNIDITFDGTEEYYDLLSCFMPLSYVLPSIVNTGGPAAGTTYLNGDVILNRNTSAGSFSGFTLKFPNQSEDETVASYPRGTTAIGYIKK